MPDALRDRLVQTYCPAEPPTESDLRRLFRRRNASTTNNEHARGGLDIRDPNFTIPKWLRYTDGPFAHQGKAVNAWCDNGGQGILEMATGSGKTIAALLCIYRLHQRCRTPLLVVVAAPYVPLIEQWCKEMRTFGLNPCNMSTMSGSKERGSALQALRRRLRLGLTSIEAVVVTHDTLCTDAFHSAASAVEARSLLVADEVHNLGRARFVTNPPSFFQHRLGLSATPVRQYDEDGTQALDEYFGRVVFSFRLKDAIGTCLVEYDYHVHRVQLNSHEMDEWYALTEKIRRSSWRSEDDKPNDVLKALLIRRRRLLETADAKVPTLAGLLDREDGLSHALIYTSDKAPGQLDEVNQLLREKGIRFHQLTACETADRARVDTVMQSFRNGDISVLTAKRVLDEGVDVPEISRAYILASTTVERQWVQRRGRVLRQCSKTGKTHSVIHDFVTIPTTDRRLDRSAQQLIGSELRRVQEFARLARNSSQPTGPQQVIDELVEAAYLSGY